MFFGGYPYSGWPGAYGGFWGGGLEIWGRNRLWRGLWERPYWNNYGFGGWGGYR